MTRVIDAAAPQASGGGGGAPVDAEYVVAALHVDLTAERILTDTAEVVWDFATPGQAKAFVLAITEAEVTGLVADLAAKVPTSRLINTTAPLTGGGDLSADRTLNVSDFVASGPSHARGTVPTPGAAPGTTRFLREDAIFAVPPGGGGSVDIKAATITAPYNSYDYSEIVVDAAVLASSQLMLSWGATTVDDENTPDMEDINFQAVADLAGGQFTAFVSAASNNAFGGPFKLNYLIG